MHQSNCSKVLKSKKRKDGYEVSVEEITGLYVVFYKSPKGKIIDRKTFMVSHCSRKVEALVWSAALHCFNEWKSALVTGEINELLKYSMNEPS